MNQASPARPNPRWRVRHQTPARWWRRLTDRRLAQADVLAPDGTRYLVRLSRNLPFRASPMPGPIDALLPNQISAALLVAANVHARGRTGWNIKIVRAPTEYRAERFLHKEKWRHPTDLVERACDLTESIQAGQRPWEDEKL